MTSLYNPRPLINGYISIMRNMFLTSSIGIVIFNLSHHFKIYSKIVQIFGLIILTYSVIIGIKASIDANKNINLIKKQKKLPELYNVQLNSWKGWINLTYIYITIIIVLSLIILIRKILK